MDTLTKLAIKYKTDKWGKHHYTPVYYELFKERQNDIKCLIEIGIAEGAGIKMFRDFFPNAIIYGADIDKKRVTLLKKKKRIISFAFDQGSVEDIYKSLEIIEVADVIIDDGSHNPVDQVFTVYGVLPFMKKGSMYIIEDVADQKVYDLLSTMSGRFLDCQLQRVGKRYDDQLIIIKKL